MTEPRIAAHSKFSGLFQKRIVFYTDDPGEGGVAIYVHAMACALARQGLDVAIIQSPSESPVVQIQRQLGVKHYWLPFQTRSNFERSVHNQQDSQAAFAAMRPDVLLFANCDPKSNLAAKSVAVQQGIPFIVVEGLVYPVPEVDALLASYLRQTAEHYRHAKGVVAVSEDNLRLLRAYFGLDPHQGEVIHYGRPSEYFRPPDLSAREQRRRELGAQPDDVVCLTVARLAPVKGHDTLLKAIVALRTRPIWSRLHFVWLGAGEWEEQLRNQVRELGISDRVHLLGHRSDTVEWLDASDVFALPTHLEGMPISIMEAMAKGLPVMASAVSGIPEQLGNTGRLLTPPWRNEEATTHEIVETLTAWASDVELRRSLGRNSKARAEAMFREEQMVDKTLDLIARAIHPPDSDVAAEVDRGVKGRVAEALADATRLHQFGQLAQAEQAYRLVLELDSQHAVALHQLGILALQRQQFAAAEQFIVAAIKSDATQPAFYANLGEALTHLGRAAEAVANYRRALQLQPALGQLHFKIGTLLVDQGSYTQAEAALRDAVQHRPDDIEARAELGRLFQAQRRFGEAEAIFREVLAQNDQLPAAYLNLGGALHAQGNFANAVSAFQRAIELKPDYAEAYFSLGAIFHQQGRLSEAADSYRASLRLRPSVVETHLELGTVLRKLGASSEAISVYRRAAELAPTHSGVQFQLGVALTEANEMEVALEVLTSVARLLPEDANVFVGLGVVQHELHMIDEAIESFRRAIELAPDGPMGYGNLGLCLQSQGRMAEAVDCFRTYIRLNPADGNTASNLLYALNYDPSASPAEVFAEHRAWAARHADLPRFKAAPHANDRSPGRRLRVGYVSSHFRSHAVSFFSEPLLAAHDHEALEIFCYSNVRPVQIDETTRRFQRYADHWRDITALNDDEASKLIRVDQIDLLVDLTGHIGGHRLLTFARKPAPIQVTYLGYQNTTGMQAMDYRLTDDWADPPGLTDAFYTEQLIRLPRTFFCFQPCREMVDVTPLPALTHGHVTFGSFNSFAKVTPDVQRTWAQILSALPNSRLVVLAEMTDSLRAGVLRTFQEHGISADRLQLYGMMPRPKFLQLMGQTDITLDPFPFNGHTTTCDSLWMGVPVVMLAGKTYASRFGGTALVQLGLHELIADSVERYREIAIALARDLEPLSVLRHGLRDKMLGSPMLDARAFAGAVETAYRQMWSRWCQLPP